MTYDNMDDRNRPLNPDGTMVEETNQPNPNEHGNEAVGAGAGALAGAGAGMVVGGPPGAVVGGRDRRRRWRACR